MGGGEGVVGGGEGVVGGGEGVVGGGDRVITQSSHRGLYSSKIGICGD